MQLKKKATGGEHASEGTLLILVAKPVRHVQACMHGCMHADKKKKKIINPIDTVETPLVYKAWKVNKLFIYKLPSPGLEPGSRG